MKNLKSKFILGFGDEDQKNVIYFAIGMFILVVGVLTILPKWQKGNNTVGIVGTNLVSMKDSDGVVDITVNWDAPWTGNCFLANDIRPKGAAKGEPESDEWNSNHLIRFNINSGQPLNEYWINIEILNERVGTKTFRYGILIPQNSTALDVYTELRCDDDLIASATQPLELQ